jgi:hypothetical protein
VTARVRFHAVSQGTTGRYVSDNTGAAQFFSHTDHAAMPKVKIGSHRSLHAHLTAILNECDGESAPAQDLSDRDAPYNQAHDARTVKSMNEAFPNLNRLRR